MELSNHHFAWVKGLLPPKQATRCFEFKEMSCLVQKLCLEKQKQMECLKFIEQWKYSSSQSSIKTLMFGLDCLDTTWRFVHDGPLDLIARFSRWLCSLLRPGWNMTSSHHCPCEMLLMWQIQTKNVRRTHDLLNVSIMRNRDALPVSLRVCRILETVVKWC